MHKDKIRHSAVEVKNKQKQKYKMQKQVLQNKITENRNQIIEIPQDKKQIPIEQLNIQSSRGLFDQYLGILKTKILKRKIILFIINVLLTLQALLFAIFIMVWGNTSNNQALVKMEQIFNTQTSVLTLLCIIFIVVLSGIFSIIIIKGKVMLLHCYWITCLIFLLILSMIAASAFAMTTMNCQQPSNYILQKVRLTSLSASSLFCSDTCPCKRPSHSDKNSVTKYQKVQDCPGWDEAIYTQLFSSIQYNFKCSGWCSINRQAYYVFYDNQEIPNSGSQISCFDSVKLKIQKDTEYLRIFSIILCVMLILIIFYCNYYIFMQKQDQDRQIKKMKRKMKQVNQKMEDQLKSSKRMLQ